MKDKKIEQDINKLLDLSIRKINYCKTDMKKILIDFASEYNKIWRENE